MRLSILSLLFLTAVFSTATICAQQPATPPPSHIDLALTYAADRTNLTTGNSFWMQGGSAELAGVLPHGFGVIAQLTGLHAGSISPTQVPLGVVTITAGPRYSWRPSWHPGKHDLILSGRALFGEAYGFDSVFPSSSGVNSSAWGLAVQAGGGVDLGLTRHTDLRLVQIDWLRTQLPNSGTNVQNHLRINTGVVFHF